MQQIAYAKTKSDTVAKLDGTYQMPEPEHERGSEIQETSDQHTGFAAAPDKAVPVNAQDAAQGQKRARDDDNEVDGNDNEDDDDDDADMDMDVSEEDSD